MELGALLLSHHDWGNAVCVVDREADERAMHRLLYLLSPTSGVYGRAYSNDLFCVRPYNWMLDDDQVAEPNFEYYPTGYKLWWYKYALRSSVANQELSEKDFSKMIRACIESVKKNNE